MEVGDHHPSPSSTAHIQFQTAAAAIQAATDDLHHVYSPSSKTLPVFASRVREPNLSPGRISNHTSPTRVTDSVAISPTMDTSVHSSVDSTQLFSTQGDATLLGCVNGQILALRPVWVKDLQRIVFVSDPSTNLPFVAEPVAIQIARVETGTTKAINPKNASSTPHVASSTSMAGRPPLPSWTSPPVMQTQPVLSSFQSDSRLRLTGQVSQSAIDAIPKAAILETAASAPAAPASSQRLDSPMAERLASSALTPVNGSTGSIQTTAVSSIAFSGKPSASGSVVNEGSLASSGSSGIKVPSRLRHFFNVSGISHADYMHAVRTKNPYTLHRFDCFVRSQCEASVAELSDPAYAARDLYATFLAFFLTNHYLYHSHQAARTLSESDLQVVCWLKGLYDLNISTNVITPEMVSNAIQWHAATVQRMSLQRKKRKSEQSLADAYGSYALAEDADNEFESDSGHDASKSNSPESDLETDQDPDLLGTPHDPALRRIGCCPCSHPGALLPATVTPVAAGVSAWDNPNEQSNGIGAPLPVLQHAWTSSAVPVDPVTQDYAYCASTALDALWTSDAALEGQIGGVHGPSGNVDSESKNAQGSKAENTYANVRDYGILPELTNSSSNPSDGFKSRSGCEWSTCRCCSGAASHPYTFLLLPLPSAEGQSVDPAYHQSQLRKQEASGGSGGGITSPQVVNTAIRSLGSDKQQQEFFVQFAQLSKSAQLVFPPEALLAPCLCGQDEQQCMCRTRSRGAASTSQRSPQPVLTKAQKLPYEATPLNFWHHWVAVERTIATISSVWALPVPVFYGFLSYEQTVSHLSSRPNGYLFRLSNSSPDLIVLAYSRPSPAYQAQLEELRLRRGFVREGEVAHLLPPPVSVSQVQIQAFTSIEAFVHFLRTNVVTKQGSVYGPHGTTPNGISTADIITQLRSQEHQTYVADTYRQYQFSFKIDGPPGATNVDQASPSRDIKAHGPQRGYDAPVGPTAYAMNTYQTTTGTNSAYQSFE